MDKKQESSFAKKQPYSTPELREFGSVAKLTQTGAGTTNADATTMMMVCL